jgi:hypothetical protein
MGFNCQLLLSEIGLTTDSSHSTSFIKSVRFSRSKSSRFYMKKILFSMFYSILVGEEPDSVFLKKEGKQNQVKMIRITPSSCAKNLTISEGIILNFHSRVPMCFHALFWFETSKNEMDKFLFLGTHTRFVTTKRITPPLTTSFSFINLIVIEIHVLARQNL